MITRIYRRTGSSAIMEVKVDGTKVFVIAKQVGVDKWTDYSVVFDKPGILKEWPDLRGQPDETIFSEGKKRWKKKCESYKSEKALIDYIEDDLAGIGFMFVEGVV